MVVFPEKPVNRSGVNINVWQIKYRTPDDDSWQTIKLPINATSKSFNFSSPGLYEVEVTAVDEVEEIVSFPKQETYCECIPYQKI